jgi:hypothetical protein
LLEVDELGRTGTLAEFNVSRRSGATVMPIEKSSTGCPVATAAALVELLRSTCCCGLMPIDSMRKLSKLASISPLSKASVTLIARA